MVLRPKKRTDDAISPEFELKRDWVKEFSYPPRVSKDIKDRAAKFIIISLIMNSRGFVVLSLSNKAYPSDSNPHISKVRVLIDLLCD